MWLLVAIPDPKAWSQHGVHRLCLPVSLIGVVARELLVLEGGKTVDGVGFPFLVVVAEDAGGQLPVGVVGLSTEAVCPNVCNAANVSCPDGDIMLVGEEEKLPQLGHHDC
jgi:hypothetical protein